MGDDTALTLDVSVGHASFSASGVSADVLKAFGDFQSLLASGIEAQQPEDIEDRPRPDEQGSGGNKAANEEVEGVVPLTEKVPLRIFLDSKKLPRGNTVLALGIALWAKRYVGVNEIDAESAKVYWRDSGRRIPANISRDLGAAATEGWLERLPTKGQFSATSYGERHFDGIEAAGE